MKEKEKFYCKICGKWLGVKDKGSETNGFFPYCPRCHKNVEITAQYNNKCQSAYK